MATEATEVKKMSEDVLFDFVQPETMTTTLDTEERAFWQYTQSGKETVVHTNPAATIEHIRQVLRNCSPRVVGVAKLEDAAAAQDRWATISAGNPTSEGSSWYFPKE